MKKLLFLFTMLACVLACSEADDNNGNPIKGLEIPSSTTPIKPGSSVTIKGEGFTQASEIWFKRIITKATESDDVKATVTEVASTGITFIAPDVYGNQSMFLKENGKKYELGKMTFEEQPGEIEDVKILPKKIKEIRDHKNGTYDSHKFDYNDKGQIKTMTIDHRYYLETYTYEYRSDKITSKIRYSDNTTDFTDATLKFDNTGRAISYEWTSKNATAGKSEPSYNENYLKQIKTSGINDIPEKYEYEENWKFIAGNLMRYDYDYKNNGGGSIDCEYSDRLNNLNLDLWGAIIGIPYFDGDRTTDFLLSNIAGKRSRLLPKQILNKTWDDNGNEETSTEILTYKLTGEYITNITITSNDPGYNRHYEIIYEK